MLIGHGKCFIIAETSVHFEKKEIDKIVYRIAGKLKVNYTEVPQDEHLADNQKDKIRCGDNGIFKGVPLTKEQKKLSDLARSLYERYNSDGKYILDGDKLVVCQSNASNKKLELLYSIRRLCKEPIINPLGEWTGGLDVDCGAVNRKLGSDMADSVTGGGLHGKDCSKADVSINIYAFLKAQAMNKPVELSCAIGDEYVDNRPYAEIVDIAKDFINGLGGFEKLAEWGLF